MDHILGKLLSVPGGIPKLLERSDLAVVFMLHRFRSPEHGILSGHDPDMVRSLLQYLRKRRYTISPLASVFASAVAGEPLSGTVAFTIDDGYVDHGAVAAPLFAQYDCPVTTFLATGFIDGDTWFWWDQVEYVFEHTRRRTFRVSIGETDVDFHWETLAERAGRQQEFLAACKLLPDEEMRAAVVRLAWAAQVEIPSKPPAMYSAMSWSDARRYERGGMTFGPHTVSHPVLSRTSNAQSRFEIVESWRRVAAELNAPAPVFCYPNGSPADFGKREENIVAETGLQGAVVGSPGYMRGSNIRQGDDRFRVPRFAIYGSASAAIQCVTGLERIKELVRERLA